MASRIRPLLLVAWWIATTAHAQTTADPPTRGQLLENPPAQLGIYSPSDLISKITDGTVSRWLLRYTFSPQCSVVVYQLRYGTVGSQGEPTTASAALMVPIGSDGACQSPRPIVLYAHGKRNLTFFNIKAYCNPIALQWAYYGFNGRTVFALRQILTFYFLLCPIQHGAIKNQALSQANLF